MIGRCLCILTVLILAPAGLRATIVADKPPLVLKSGDFTGGMVFRNDVCNGDDCTVKTVHADLYTRDALGFNLTVVLVGQASMERRDRRRECL